MGFSPFIVYRRMGPGKGLVCLPNRLHLYLCAKMWQNLDVLTGARGGLVTMARSGVWERDIRVPPVTIQLYFLYIKVQGVQFGLP